MPRKWGHVGALTEGYRDLQEHNKGLVLKCRRYYVGAFAPSKEAPTDLPTLDTGPLLLTCE